MSLPDPSVVLDLIDGFRRSKVMFTALAMGIFDHSPAPAAGHASRLEANTDAMARLLDACVSLGFLEQEAGVYRNTPVAATYLSTASPHSMAGYILYSNQVLYQMWGNLEDAVREGSHRWRQTFGFDGPIFDHFFKTEATMRTFVMGMHGFGMQTSPTVVRMFDLSRFRRLVDLGGATGHLTIAACECYPELEGAVFDLPKVVPVAAEQIARSPAANRLRVLAGDFFQDELPPADLYAVGRILHDWAPEKIQVLLRKIYEALPEGGGLLIAEKLMADDRSGPVHVHMQSLNMLICTEGRERSLSEYREELRRAGFGEVHGAKTGTAVDAVLALKTKLPGR